MPDSNLTALPQDFTPASADLLYLAKSPFGPTDDRKVAVGDLISGLTTSLQEAYDGGNNILYDGSHAVSVRASGIAWGDNNFALIGTDTTGASPFAVGFSAVKDASSGLPALAVSQQVLADTAITFPSATSIEFGVDLVVAGAVVGYSSIGIKLSNVVADESIYSIASFSNGSTTNSIANIGVDYRTFLPPTFTSTTGTAVVSLQGDAMGASNNHFYSVSYPATNPSGGDLYFGSNFGGTLSEGFGLTNTSGTMGDGIIFNNVLGATLTGSGLRLVNGEATYAGDFVSIVNNGTGPDIVVNDGTFDLLEIGKNLITFNGVTPFRGILGYDVAGANTTVMGSADVGGGNLLNAFVVRKQLTDVGAIIQVVDDTLGLGSVIADLTTFDGITLGDDAADTAATRFIQVYAGDGIQGKRFEVSGSTGSLTLFDNTAYTYGTHGRITSQVPAGAGARFGFDFVTQNRIFSTIVPGSPFNPSIMPYLFTNGVDPIGGIFDNDSVLPGPFTIKARGHSVFPIGSMTANDLGMAAMELNGTGVGFYAFGEVFTSNGMFIQIDQTAPGSRQITIGASDFANAPGDVLPSYVLIAGQRRIMSQVSDVSNPTLELQNNSINTTDILGTGSAWSISTTGVLSDGMTATTQAANDNTTKIATTAYVDAAVGATNSLQEAYDNGNTINATIGLPVTISSSFAAPATAIFGGRINLDSTLGTADAHGFYVTNTSTGTTATIVNGGIFEAIAENSYMAGVQGSGYYNGINTTPGGGQPLVIGTGGNAGLNTGVTTDKVITAISSFGNSQTIQTGENIGGAFIGRNSLGRNAGVAGYANASDVQLFTALFTLPSTFSSALYGYNVNTGVDDYALYLDGTTKSYIGGNLEIGGILEVGSVAGAPTLTVDGQMQYNSTSDRLIFRANAIDETIAYLSDVTSADEWIRTGTILSPTNVGDQVNIAGTTTATSHLNSINAGIYTGTTSNSQVAIINSNGSTSGSQLWVQSNSDASGAAPIVHFSGSNISFGQQVLRVDSYGTVFGTQLINSGTGGVLFLNNNSNSRALLVQHSGTTQDAIQITSSSLTTGSFINALSSSVDTGTRTLLNINNSSALATGVTTAKFTNASTGLALSVDGQTTLSNLSNVGGSGRSLTSVRTKSGPPGDMAANFFQLNDGAASAIDTVMEVEFNQTVSKTAQISSGFRVDMNGNATDVGGSYYGIEILGFDNPVAATTNRAINIDMTGWDVGLNTAITGVFTGTTTSSAFVIDSTNAGTTGTLMYVKSDSNASSAAPMVHFENTASTFDQPTVKISGNNNGEFALVVDQAASGGGIKITKASAGGAHLYLPVSTAFTGTGNSSAFSIEGTNTGITGTLAYISSAANASAANPAVVFQTTNAANDQPVLQVLQAGTSAGIVIGAVPTTPSKLHIVGTNQFTLAIDSPANPEIRFEITNTPMQQLATNTTPGGYFATSGANDFIFFNTNARNWLFGSPTAGEYMRLTDAGRLGINTIAPDEKLHVVGNAKVVGRILGAKGADVASGSNITLGNDGNVFDITGAVTINTFTPTGWTAGSIITLQFDAALTLTHNSGGTNDFMLAGSANLTTAALTRVLFYFDGTDLIELSRTTA